MVVPARNVSSVRNSTHFVAVGMRCETTLPKFQKDRISRAIGPAEILEISRNYRGVQGSTGKEKESTARTYPSLGTTLVLYSNWKSGELRGVIYSLLSICSFKKSRPVPDYGKLLEAVFSDVAKPLIVERYSFMPIIDCGIDEGSEEWLMRPHLGIGFQACQRQ
jgi:hypothetical protein